MDDEDTSTTVANATIDSASDEDWYRVTVLNTTTGGICCGDPKVQIALTNIPVGSDYELGAWYQCPPSDGSTPSCTSGSTDNSLASGGCVSTQSGNLAEQVAFDTNCDPDGVLYVRVDAFRWAGTCDPYTLEVFVH
jgi:hypothetical protein